MSENSMTVLSAAIIDVIIDFTFSHAKLVILVTIIFFAILMIIIFIGNSSPSYSRWFKASKALDKFANKALVLLGIIGFGELLLVIYVLTQLFKYGR